MQYSVTAVVVSYNRARLLDECLSALNAQTRRPDSVSYTHLTLPTIA